VSPVGDSETERDHKIRPERGYNSERASERAETRIKVTTGPTVQCTLVFKAVRAPADNVSALTLRTLVRPSPPSHPPLRLGARAWYSTRGTRPYVKWEVILCDFFHSHQWAWAMARWKGAGQHMVAGKGRLRSQRAVRAGGVAWRQQERGEGAVRARGILTPGNGAPVPKKHSKAFFGQPARIFHSMT